MTFDVCHCPTTASPLALFLCFEIILRQHSSEAISLHLCTSQYFSPGIKAMKLNESKVKGIEKDTSGRWQRGLWPGPASLQVCWWCSFHTQLEALGWDQGSLKEETKPEQTSSAFLLGHPFGVGFDWERLLQGRTWQWGSPAEVGFYSLSIMSSSVPIPRN